MSGVVNRLFRQGADGRFIDVSKGSGLDIAGYNMGVAIGDVNNDGRLDVLVTQYGGIRLFLNQGNGTFKDVTSESKLASRLWGMSAAFLDYDRDGWLDLVVVNYLNYDPSRWCAGPDGRQDFCGPSAFLGTVAKLFRNLGGAKQIRANSAGFQEVTVEAGLALNPGPGLGVFCGDFSGDHWPDIVVANDGKPNHLWINQRDGTFKEEAVARNRLQRHGSCRSEHGDRHRRYRWRRSLRRPGDPLDRRDPDPLAAETARALSGPDRAGWPDPTSLARLLGLESCWPTSIRTARSTPQWWTAASNVPKWLWLSLVATARPHRSGAPTSSAASCLPTMVTAGFATSRWLTLRSPAKCRWGAVWHAATSTATVP